MESERVDSYDLMVSEPFLSPRGSELQWLLRAVREISIRIKLSKQSSRWQTNLCLPTCRIESAGNVALNL